MSSTKVLLSGVVDVQRTEPTPKVERIRIQYRSNMHWIGGDAALRTCFWSKNVLEKTKRLENSFKSVFSAPISGRVGIPTHLNLSTMCNTQLLKGIPATTQVSLSSAGLLLKFN